MVAEPPAIAIVTDGSADVPAIERGSAAWTVLPDIWRGGGLELRDLGEQSRELTRLVLGSTAMTVQSPTRKDFEGAFRKHAGVDRIYSIHASSMVSDAVAAAREAAVLHPNVLVVETSVGGIGVGLLAIRVRQLAEAGATTDEVDAYLAQHAKSSPFLIVPDRFDPAGRQRMSTARLLSGRPLLSAQGGDMARSRRLRSRRQTVLAIERYFQEHAPADRVIRMAIGHGDAAGAVDPFLDILERMRSDASVELVGRIGPRLVERLGARCVGIAWTLE